VWNKKVSVRPLLSLIRARELARWRAINASEVLVDRWLVLVDPWKMPAQAKVIGLSRIDALDIRA